MNRTLNPEGGTLLGNKTKILPTLTGIRKTPQYHHACEKHHQQEAQEERE